MNILTILRVLRVFIQGAAPTIVAVPVAPRDTWGYIALGTAALAGGCHAIAQMYAEPPPDTPAQQVPDTAGAHVETHAEAAKFAVSAEKPEQPPKLH